MPLFSWEIVDRSGEILRLERILQILPDQPLLEALCAKRKKKRDDYPLEALWHSVLAGVLVGHESIAKLIRELRRNRELREVCGFDPLLGERAVPPDYVFSRFFARLLAHEALIKAMFEQLLERVAKLLPGFGRHLAIDTKALPVLGPKPPDADMGTKAYEGDATPLKKVQHWFGYKLHLIVDAVFELPVAYDVTRASEADSPHLMPMIESLGEKHPTLHERIETVAADKAYDDGADKAALWDEQEIVALIPPRDCYTNTQGERMRPLDPSRSDTIYIGPTGEVCCRIAPFEKEESKAFATMEFRGFEKDRDTLKFRCPAAAFGLQCRNRAACRCRPAVREGKYGRTVRIPLSLDPRLFTPIYSHGRRFRAAYKRRSAVERVNSRLDNVHGFERAFVRSREKMAVRVGLALAVMLATAVAWSEAGKQGNVRCLLRAA
jgi:hypothetical protein